MKSASMKTTLAYIKPILTSLYVFIGVGPVTAMKLIREHKSLEEVLKHVDGKVKTEESIKNHHVV